MGVLSHQPSRRVPSAVHQTPARRCTTSRAAMQTDHHRSLHLHPTCCVPNCGKGPVFRFAAQPSSDGARDRATVDIARVDRLRLQRAFKISPAICNASDVPPATGLRRFEPSPGTVEPATDDISIAIHHFRPRCHLRRQFHRRRSLRGQQYG